jgi:NADH-quinone oxidoreductase subunit L
MNAWIAGWLPPPSGGPGLHWYPHLTPVGIATMAVVAVGIGVSWWLFGRGPIPAAVPYTSNPFIIAGRHDLYGDAFNETVLMRPGQALTSAVTTIDEKVVDGAVRQRRVRSASVSLRRLQNGYVRSYGLTMVLGLLVIGFPGHQPAGLKGK